VQAISMLHNQVLFDRRINVRMDKSNERDGPLKLPEGLKGIGMGLGANGAPLTDVARNLPSLNLSSVQPASGLSASTPTLAALAGLSQSLDSRLLDTALARRQLDLAGVGGLGLSSSADLGLGTTNLSNSYGSGLNVGNAGTGSGGGYLNSSNSYSAGGGLGGRGFDSLSAALNSSSVSKYDYDFGVGDRSLDRVSSADLRYAPERRSDTIIITNLPPTTTWKALRDQFHEAGDIKFAEMKTKDVGVVRFSRQDEADRAVSLYDRSRFDGRIIDVRLF
jgi:hypothetical protein